MKTFLLVNEHNMNELQWHFATMLSFSLSIPIFFVCILYTEISLIYHQSIYFNVLYMSTMSIHYERYKVLGNIHKPRKYK